MNWLHSFFIRNNAKLWTNLVYAVITWKIWATPLEKISETLILIWMGVVGGSELIKRVLTTRFGSPKEEPSALQESSPRALLQCKSCETREAGSERGGVEPGVSGDGSSPAGKGNPGDR